jgi:hypothetical protein
LAAPGSINDRIQGHDEVTWRESPDRSSGLNIGQGKKKDDGYFRFDWVQYEIPGASYDTSVSLIDLVRGSPEALDLFSTNTLHQSRIDLDPQGC